MCFDSFDALRKNKGTSNKVMASSEAKVKRRRPLKANWQAFLLQAVETHSNIQCETLWNALTENGLL